MRLDTMLAAAGDSSDLTVQGSANADLKLDISSAAEQRVAESVNQELDYWEKLVFSFDMERDQGGPPPPDTASNPRGRTKRRAEQAQAAGIPPMSSGPPPPSGSASQSHGQQPMDSRHIPNSSFSSNPPNMAGQMQNPQLAQLNQLAGLDPYTLAHLAALSALQNGQHIPGSQPNPADPFAILRQVQGLLYPFGNANPGNGGSLPGLAQGFSQQQSSSSHHPSSGSNRSGAQQSAQNPMAESSGHPWPSQLPGIGSIQFPMQSLDPSLIGQLSQLPPLMLPNAYSQPTQTPGAGPSSGGSRARSRSTASASSPSTPISPTNSRAASLMDETAIAEDKRRRNTAASARFRIKKKHKTLALERSVVELEARADDLEREAAELRRENGWLKEMLIMKGRSVRAQASAVAAQMDEDEEDEASGNEGEEDNHDVVEEPEDASSKKGKGKEKAT